MFKSSDKDKTAKKDGSLTAKTVTPSVLAHDVNVLGNIISEGYLDIDGRIEGNIKCVELTVRKNGIVKGDIIADTVNIYGRVKGLIKGKHVNLYKTCSVEGIIMHEAVSIEDGAQVDGQFKRSNKPIEEMTEDESAASGSSLIENIRLITEKKPA